MKRTDRMLTTSIRWSVLATALICTIILICCRVNLSAQTDDTITASPAGKTLFQVYVEDSMLTDALRLIDKAATDTVYWSGESLRLLQDMIRFERTLAMKKARAKIAHAEDLAGRGETDEALTLLATVRDESNDLSIISEARAAEKELLKTDAWKDLWDAAGELLGYRYVSVILCILVLYSLLYGCFRLLAELRSDRKWHMGEVEDTTGQQIGYHAVTTLSAWIDGRPLMTSGQLRQDSIHLGSDIEIPITPGSFDVSSAIQSVHDSWQTRILQTLFNHLRQTLQRHRSSVEISILLVDKELVARFSLLRGRQSNISVFERCESDCELDHKLRIIERGCFRMSYFILNELDRAASEGGGELFDGLQLLRKYAQQGDASMLKESICRFEEARAASPGLLEAHLYEGIALDMNEQHDDSIRRLTYLINAIENQSSYTKNQRLVALRERAIYSRAVSRHRKYNMNYAEAAIEDLQQLTESESRTSDPLLKAHAHVLRAIIMAHLPLYLRHDIQSVKEFRSQAHMIAEQVETYLNHAEELDQNLPEDVRTSASRHELDYFIRNAKGSIELNIAAALRDTSIRNIAGNTETAPELEADDVGVRNHEAVIEPAAESNIYERPIDEHVKQQIDEQLSRAYDHFRYCEDNFPVRIETLMNLATTFLYQHEYEQAAEYCRRGIELNNKYEYAYYRLFQTIVEKHAGSPPKGELQDILQHYRENTGKSVPVIRGFRVLLDDNLRNWR